MSRLLFRLNTPEGGVDVSGVDKIFKFIATIPLCSTLYSYGTDKEIYAKQKVNNFRL